MNRNAPITRDRAGRSGGVMRLSRARLTPVGGHGGVGVAAWIAGAGAALSGAWLVYNALRPFGGAEASGAQGVEVATLPGAFARDLEERQRELNALVAAANLFDPDRKRWPEPTETVQADGAEDDQERVITSAPDEGSEARQVQASAGEADDGASDDDLAASIPLTESPPASLTQRLRALTLVAIYGADGRYTAVIRDSTLPAAEGQTRHHRRGDIVGAEQWELLGVDPKRDRVILRRAGANLELRMYPEAVALARREEASASGSSEPSRERDTLTPEEVRRGLAEAGVPEEDIAELLRLAQSDEPLDAEAEDDASSIATGAEGPARIPASGGGGDDGPAMPAELSALLRAMAQDAARRSNRAQPSPEPESEEENGEGEGGGG